jgi:hypothetical protein
LSRRTKQQQIHDLKFQLERLQQAARDTVSAYLKSEENLRDPKVSDIARWPMSVGMLSSNIPYLGRLLAEQTGDEHLASVLKADEERRKREFQERYGKRGAA